MSVRKVDKAVQVGRLWPAEGDGSPCIVRSSYLFATLIRIAVIKYPSMNTNYNNSGAYSPYAVHTMPTAVQTSPYSVPTSGMSHFPKYEKLL